MRFLIIDDSITMRRIIANILGRLGYPDAIHASNGREALDRLATEEVDVVITDWYMPEMNGLDFVKSLRNTPATSHIPIMIVTANAASDDIQHALELGVNSYILKPFTVETMREKIGTLCEQEGFQPPTDPNQSLSTKPKAAPPAEEVVAADPAAAPAATAAAPAEAVVAADVTAVTAATPGPAGAPESAPVAPLSAASDGELDEEADSDIEAEPETQARPQAEAAAAN